MMSKINVNEARRIIVEPQSILKTPSQDKAIMIEILTSI
ncbi:hypothetical protein SynBIOSE41_02380 [Synechococcus sp. BIOS-E4-1]|nr:hypothetical protein SynBIOSE41_02380 [Synechococcus sp. BIOS-E4-1]